MKILNSIKEWKTVSGKSLYLGIGNFDGFHLGHQALLRRVKNESVKQHGISAVFTFAAHPQAVLHPAGAPLLLTPLAQKIDLLRNFGIETCFVIRFTPEFSEQTPEIFVKKILVDRLQVKKIFLGENARFGHGRVGDTGLMKSLAQRFSFGFEEVSPVLADSQPVSSSRIRTHIKQGDFAAAEKCLGRPFSSYFEVTRGDQRGRTIGFPTANLKTEGHVMPPPGVYPVEVRVANASGQESLWIKGVLNYGNRPTFSSSAAEVAEIHLLDVDLNLYGRMLEVKFHPRLRSEKKFSTVELLIKQIEQDIAQVRSIFKSADKISGCPKGQDL